MFNKGWEQACLLKAFDIEFQKQAMLESMVKPLLSNREVQAIDTNCNDKIDVEVSLDTVMRTI